MKTLTMRTTIAADGTIDLHIPCDLPPGDAEVVIIVQPSGLSPARTAVSLSGRFPSPTTESEDVMDSIRRIRRESTQASWELAE
ncbi:MAG TPA: hypothetical protein VGM05_14835 [Planctomycetaceae bacterium]|jgi:hypothetical protein